MTASTETEQLHQLLELVLTELDRKSIPFAYMQEIDREGKAFIEQVARRAPTQPQWPQFEKCQDAFDAAKNLYPQGNPLGGDHEWHWFQAGWNGRAPVVPDIPTKTMLKAAQKADCDYSPFNEWLQDNGRDFIAMYRAAISAAPATNGKQSA